MDIDSCCVSKASGGFLSPPGTGVFRKGKKRRRWLESQRLGLCDACDIVWWCTRRTVCCVAHGVAWAGLAPSSVRVLRTPTRSSVSRHWSEPVANAARPTDPWKLLSNLRPTGASSTTAHLFFLSSFLLLLGVDHHLGFSQVDLIAWSCYYVGEALVIDIHPHLHLQIFCCLPLLADTQDAKFL